MQEESIRKLIGPRIRSLIEKKGITQGDLAKAVGVTQGAVSGWTGGAIPRGDQVYAVARYFGVSMEYLLTGDDDHTSVVQEAEAIYRLTSGRDREVKQIAEDLIKLGKRLQALFA